MVGEDCGGSARIGRNAAGLEAGGGCRASGFGKSGAVELSLRNVRSSSRLESHSTTQVFLKLAASTGAGGLRLEWPSANLVWTVVIVLRSAGNVSLRVQRSSRI